MKCRNIRLLIIVLSSVLLFSCSKKKSFFEVTEFNSITNPEFKNNDTLVFVEANLDDAPLNGIRIPTAQQCAGGKFSFNFKIKRLEKSNDKLYYKLFYQNETYKFSEDHEYSGENFYGSWEDSNIGFKEISSLENEISIIDSLVIVGNPRNEQLYYGPNPANGAVDDQLLANTIAFIKNDPVWFEQIKKKIITEKRTLEEQLTLDALWSISELHKNQGNINNRLWRNPRMGNYEFMLVVISEAELKKIPYHQKSIQLPTINATYINPFSFFKTGKGSKLDNVVYAMGNKKIKTKAHFNLGAGLYVDNKQVGRENFNKDNYKSSCGDTYKLYKYAHFQQYFHWINKDFPLKNIPEVIDVMDPRFTRAEYEKFEKLYSTSKKFIDTYVNSSDCPCKTVNSDSASNSITLINPGNKDGEYKKEHVGVVGRIGFTYGKWRAKLNFRNSLIKIMFGMA